MKKMGKLCWLSQVLVVIGAINWGLVGAFEWNLVSAIFSPNLVEVERVIYVLVGLAGIYSLVGMFMCCGKCKE